MPTTHTVQQGETLTRIAKLYNYGSAMALYNHPDNAEFKKLRADPNLIFPGDKITIPDIDPKQMQARAGQKYTFCLKEEIEHFKVRLLDDEGEPLQGARLVLDLGSQQVDLIVASDGMVEVPLTNGDESAGSIEVYSDPNAEEPDQTFEVQLAHLDPVEQLSGVQARCNLLGHPCGVADGVMGRNTRAGVKSFQEANGLDVDGEPGPMTKGKLKEVYGS